ncbi:MAG: hypothetical protein NZ769_08250, partial [Anaerolineae bacterium]|nr:hypothetical protein [Anaerolineae bacterium]
MDGMQGMPYGYGYGPEYGSRPMGSVESRVAKRLGVVLLVFTAAFGLTLAVMVGQRLSEEAMAVLAGAVCGVVASLPPSLLIVWVTKRRQEQRMVAGPYPPVVVVQPPLPAASSQGSPPMGMAYPPVAYGPPAPREFVVVGE